MPWGPCACRGPWRAAGTWLRHRRGWRWNRRAWLGTWGEASDGKYPAPHRYTPTTYRRRTTSPSVSCNLPLHCTVYVMHTDPLIEDYFPHFRNQKPNSLETIEGLLPIHLCVNGAPYLRHTSGNTGMHCTGYRVLHKTRRKFE